MSSKNPKLNCYEISLNTFTDRVVGTYNCFKRQMSFGFADLPLLAMSSKFSGYEDVSLETQLGQFVNCWISMHPKWKT